MKTLLTLILAASIIFGQGRISNTCTIEVDINYCADANGNDTYTCSLSPAITAYQTSTVSIICWNEAT